MYNFYYNGNFKNFPNEVSQQNRVNIIPIYKTIVSKKINYYKIFSH